MIKMFLSRLLATASGVLAILSAMLWLSSAQELALTANQAACKAKCMELLTPFANEFNGWSAKLVLISAVAAFLAYVINED